jgi:hypothetical protein
LFWNFWECSHPGQFTMLLVCLNVSQSRSVLHRCRYIYTSHDLEGARGYNMRDYVCMSSADLVNWRDEGVVLSFDNITWAQYAWAQQVL